MKDESLYLVHMLECLKKIEIYTIKGHSDFLQNSQVQDAVLRNFEIIGEAAKRVSPATRSLSPGIPWQRIAGFRDVLIHQYEGVDMEEVWKRIEQDLPSFHQELLNLQEKIKNKPS